MGYTGPEKVNWVRTASKPRHQGPAVINEMITTPAAEAEISEYSSEHNMSGAIRLILGGVERAAV